MAGPAVVPHEIANLEHPPPGFCAWRDLRKTSCLDSGDSWWAMCEEESQSAQPPPVKAPGAGGPATGGRASRGPFPPAGFPVPGRYFLSTTLILNSAEFPPMVGWYMLKTPAGSAWKSPGVSARIT
jgi:hypothetical protein